MKLENEKVPGWGDEAPELKHFIIVIVAVAVLIAFGWITWFKFGWFH